MRKKATKILKYLILIFIISTLFFILLNIQKEESIKQKEKTEKVSTKTQIDTNVNKNSKAINILDKLVTQKEKIDKTYKNYKVSAQLYIPKINLETYVLEEFSKNALLTSVTKFYGDKPNKIGNFCIAGHNFGPSNMFQNLKKLEIGDELYLTDEESNKVKYEIYDIYKVFPKQTEVLSQSTNGNVELTLITCTIDSEKRIIVKARAPLK